MTKISAEQMTATKYHIAKVVKCRNELTITSESYKTKTEALKHCKRGYEALNKKQVLTRLQDGWIDTVVIAAAIEIVENITVNQPQETKSAAQIKAELNADCTVSEYEEYLRLRAKARQVKKHTNKSTIHKSKRDSLTGTQRAQRLIYNQKYSEPQKQPVESISQPKRTRKAFSQKKLVIKLTSQLIADKKWSNLFEASSDELAFIGLIADIENVIESKGYKVSANIEKWAQDAIINHFKVECVECKREVV